MESSWFVDESVCIGTHETPVDAAIWQTAASTMADDCIYHVVDGQTYGR